MSRRFVVTELRGSTICGYCPEDWELTEKEKNMSKQIKVGDRVQFLSAMATGVILHIEGDYAWIRWDKVHADSIERVDSLVVVEPEPEYPKVLTDPTDQTFAFKLDEMFLFSGWVTADKVHLLIKRLEAALAEMEKDNG